MSWARQRLSAPTGGLMLMSLSLSTTSRLQSATPALFSASKAMPALIAPSPMMATVWRLSPFSLAARARPPAGQGRGLECAGADDGHGVAALALALGRQRHAQRGRDAGARMRRAEGVVHALAALRKARDAALLAQRVHALTPAGQYLVRIGLVAHVPYQAV